MPAVAKALIDWMKAKADRIAIDARVYRSIGPEFMIQGQPCSPLRFWTDGSIAVNFVQLKMTPAFASPTARLELFETRPFRRATERDQDWSAWVLRIATIHLIREY